VYKLRNAAAADVANTIQTFVTNSLNVLSGANFLTAYQNLQRQVVVVAEPVSNTVLISATPQYFNEIKRLIEKIDAQPPQVVIQVMIAEVQLNNAEEFGVEFGIQSPVLFARGVLPTATTTNGVTNAAVPGYNFVTTAPLGNSTLAQSPTVGFQGLSQLGVGRVGTQGFGGFVFSASSDSLNVLVRALSAQSRVDILSRPQVQVADNQTGYVQVGANFPYLSASTLTGVGTAQQSIEYQPIGVTMRVTPRVNPDGKVLMRVEPQVASVSPTPVNLGNGINAPAFNVQTVQTTVLASDGETIVLGGLLSKQDQRVENGYPFFKDLPYVGALFRYRTRQTQRREVLIIMTPHIVRSEADQARILAEESQRMHWCVPDISRLQGHGMEVIGPAMHGARPVPTNITPPAGAPTYVPGPYYFGGPGSPDGAYGLGSAPLPPGLQPAQPVPTQPALAQPQPFNPGGAPQPGASPVPAPATPAVPVPPPAPPQPQQGFAVPPQAQPQPLPGVPVMSAAPNVTPASAAFPAGPLPPGTAPAQPQPPQGRSFQMVTPDGRVLYPTAVVPAPQPVSPTAHRGFEMRVPESATAPAGGPTDDKKPRAREGAQWDVFKP
jgi:Flp pilus assembly secretin CpaC